MKRSPFYRRPGAPGKFSGLRERTIWMIQARGRPVTGSEIAEKFGATLPEFNRAARGLLRGTGKIAKIVVVEEWQTPDGVKDRSFDLVTKPKLILPAGKTPIFSKKQAMTATEERRQENIRKAAIRRRLISNGLYIDEMEAAL
ncbi:regulator [Klebsiella oxytoca]|uniref:regulator n=1 Tax=Klebsiella oxytoca TaxID=571 RepID=UPI0025974DE7|nr:regulator [Klebsiella oxytoca]MDM4157332.1 regulator [Klebsiella oxytoca]MDM4190631.1 regulator [Klebsiella oxytoca]MDM4224013.1 regulator [Klebsiella oxytoca]MDM4238156.1 regulator [Klebsiella oxytoca]MDM4334614.1 regulator [Klebsiella oxytoca]